MQFKGRKENQIGVTETRLKVDLFIFKVLRVLEGKEVNVFTYPLIYTVKDSTSYTVVSINVWSS